MDAFSFACDAMLGGLARWLRFAGFDVAFDPLLGDAELAGQARAEGRWLLTRDRRLAAAAGPRVVLLRAGGTAALVAELRSRLPLAADPARFLTRCSRCNGELAAAPAEAVRDRVPPYVAAHAARFLVCAGCGKVYWRGTHRERIERTLRALFGDPGITPG